MFKTMTFNIKEWSELCCKRGEQYREQLSWVAEQRKRERGRDEERKGSHFIVISQLIA